MGKKENKKIVSLKKDDGKKEISFRGELETYLLFGLVVLFVGIFIGTTASAIAIYRNNNSNLDAAKLVNDCTPSNEDEISTDDLDLNEIKEISAP